MSVNETFTSFCSSYNYSSFEKFQPMTITIQSSVFRLLINYIYDIAPIPIKILQTCLNYGILLKTSVLQDLDFHFLEICCFFCCFFFFMKTSYSSKV